MAVTVSQPSKRQGARNYVLQVPALPIYGTEDQRFECSRAAQRLSGVRRGLAGRR
jgi:hypothetical protein